MKNLANLKLHNILKFFILSVFLVFSSCENSILPLQDFSAASENDGLGEKKSSWIIFNIKESSKDSASRSISSVVTSSLFNYITFEGVSSNSSTVSYSASSFSELAGKKIYVDTGSWNFTLTAYLNRAVDSSGTVTSEGEKYTATQSLTVNPGSNSLSMKLKADSSSLSSPSEHPGSWSVKVIFPSENIDLVSLQLISYSSAVSGGAMDSIYEEKKVKGTDYFGNGTKTVTFSQDSCDAGNYLIHISFECIESTNSDSGDYDYSVLNDWGEFMAVNPGLLSSGTITLPSSDAVYSVTLNTNGGEWNTSSYTAIPVSYTKNSGETDGYGNNTGKITLPGKTDFDSRSGYFFEGWYETSDFSGSPVTEFNVSDKENKTFYAKWKETKVYVSSSGKDSDSAYDGSSFAKAFNSVARAVTYIKNESQSDADWLICVDGTVYGTINLDLSGFAKSLEIQGSSSAYTSAALDSRASESAATSGQPVVTVPGNYGNPFSVSLKNITLKKGGNGALNIGSGANVTLTNCLVTDNVGESAISYSANATLTLVDTLINGNKKSDGISDAYALSNTSYGAAAEICFAGATKIAAENKVFANGTIQPYKILSELTASKPVMVIETTMAVGDAIIEGDDSEVLSKASKKILLSDSSKEIDTLGKIAVRTIHDVYISEDGSDVSGDGSEETPYATLRKALQSLTNKTALNAANSFVNNIYILSDYNVENGVGVDFKVYANIYGAKGGTEGSSVKFNVNTSSDTCFYVDNEQKFNLYNIDFVSDATPSNPNEYAVLYVTSGTEVHLENVNFTGITGKSVSAIHIDGNCYMKNSSVTSCRSVSDSWGSAIFVKTGQLHIEGKNVIKGNSLVKADGTVLKSNANIWIGHNDGTEYYHPLVVEGDLTGSEIWVTPYNLDENTQTPIPLTSGYSDYNSSSPSQIFKTDEYQIGKINSGSDYEAGINNGLFISWAESYDFTSFIKAEDDYVKLKVNFTDGFGTSVESPSIYYTSSFADGTDVNKGSAASPLAVSGSEYTLEVSAGAVSVTVNAVKTVSGISYTAQKTQSINPLLTSLYVSESGNDDNGIGCKEAPFATLQKAIDKISSYEDSSVKYTVNILGTVKGSSLIDAEGAFVEKAFKASELCILGTSATSSILDGNGNSKILDINATMPITLKNLTLQNGNSATSGGGAISMDGTASLIITDCVIKNNKSSQLGGAIFLGANASLSVGYTSIVDNECIGSEINSKGGAIFSHGGTVNLLSTTITSCTAQKGGAVYMAQKDDHGTKKGSDLYISSATSIPEATLGNNDIYLEDLCTIHIGNTLTASAPVATLTLQNYEAGRQVLTSSIESFLASGYSKFAVIPEHTPSGDFEWYIDSEGKLRKSGQPSSLNISFAGDIEVSKTEKADGTITLSADSSYSDFSWSATPSIDDSETSGDAGEIFTFNKEKLESGISYSILLTAKKNSIPFSTTVTVTTP